MSIFDKNDTALIRSYAKQAIDRMRCGFSPPDAIEGVLAGAHVGGCPLSSAERERITSAVYRADNRSQS